jgi:hypothetical protein
LTHNFADRSCNGSKIAAFAPNHSHTVKPVDQSARLDKNKARRLHRALRGQACEARPHRPHRSRPHRPHRGRPHRPHRGRPHRPHRGSKATRALMRKRIRARPTRGQASQASQEFGVPSDGQGPTPKGVSLNGPTPKGVPLDGPCIRSTKRRTPVRPTVCTHCKAMQAQARSVRRAGAHAQGRSAGRLVQLVWSCCPCCLPLAFELWSA